ncbi:uncharacterized protein [Nicotiana tomentosiformis]|uniref:uncharacterized protein n=1 Tax=Nicotiana tomentosiformis TaxID=4098 RepID=UPI00388C8EDB
MRDVMRFRRKGKLSSRYIGLFEILEREGEVAYRIALPPSLSGVHPVFYVSMHHKYYGDPSHVLDFCSVQLDKDLTYVEESTAILDKHVQKLRSKNIASVKVHWRSQPFEEATWDTDNDIRSRYPHIFWIDLGHLVPWLKKFKIDFGPFGDYVTLMKFAGTSVSHLWKPGHRCESKGVDQEW